MNYSRNYVSKTLYFMKDFCELFRWLFSKWKPERFRRVVCVDILNMLCVKQITLHKEWSFPLKISSVNRNKFAFVGIFAPKVTSGYISCTNYYRLPVWAPKKDSRNKVYDSYFSVIAYVFCYKWKMKEKFLNSCI